MEKSVPISKIPQSLKTYLSIELFKRNYSPVLLCENIVIARQVKAELELIGYKEETLLFTFEQESIQSLPLEEFLSKVQKKNYIILSTPKILNQRIISRDKFNKGQVEINLNLKLGYDELIELLESFGYIKQKIC